MSKTATTIVLITMVLAVTSGLNSVMAAEPNTPAVLLRKNEAAGAKMDPFKMNQLLGRGVNMGNALDAPSEGEWGFTLEEKYFQAAKDAGFNSVRIPVRWSAHALAEPPYTIDPNFLKRVDWAVNCALSRNMPVMLNVHHYLELLSDPAGHRERFLAIWQQIAEHYKNYPDTLLLEPLNEPQGKIGVSEWNSLLKQAIDVIRKSNPNRILVIGPAWANTIGNLNSLQIPKDDRNIIVSIHYYDPLEFTHQGAFWITDRDSNSWLGTKWPTTDAQKKVVIKDFDIAVAWAKQNNRPMNLGEFGSYNKADMDSRARWTKFLADAAIERGFSFDYWQFDSDFAVYDTKTNTWIKPLLEALIPPKQ
jgi:endoglucanase